MKLFLNYHSYFYATKVRQFEFLVALGQHHVSAADVDWSGTLIATNASQALPQRIYNSHYGNVYLLVLSSWKVNIAENPIAVMGL